MIYELRKFKFILLLIFFLLIPQLTYAACGGTPTESPSGTWTTYDASYDCVTDAIQNYATAGETVVIANGNATWNSQLSIDKHLILQGGTGTITNGGSSFLIRFAPATPTQANVFELKNMTVSGAFFKAYNSSATVPITINIHDNTVTSTSGYVFETDGGPVYGVVYSNTFNYSSNEQFDLLGSDSNWNNFQHEYGTANALYIEDNTFSGADRPIDSGQGFKGYVARYNDIINTGVDTRTLFDMHGDYPTWGCGTMHGEFYGNKVTSTPATLVASQRGGWALSFYNGQTSTSAIYGGKLYNDFTNDSGGCPAHANNSVDEDISNSYYWSNANSSGAQAGIATAEGVPTANEDYWLYTESFNGTSGVGCGTTRPGTCTTGTAFWETSQSCSTLADYIGTTPTTPISGTLYKCTATDTWTEYYEPYTYPHPLRTEAYDIVAPASPTGLAVS